METTSKSRRKHRKLSHNKPKDTASIDRISALPDDVLFQILAFLPTKLSVATSILARRWRFLWTHIPNIDFDGFTHRAGSLTKSFSIINRFMSLHKGQNLNTFRLHHTYYCSNNDFEKWTTIAIESDVKNIYLELNLSDMLPKCLFTCKTLVDLRLRYCGDIPNSGNVYLPALKKLHLYTVRYKSNESVRHVLSGCPVLEELIIETVNAHVFCGYISSPTLKRLIINSNFGNIDNKAYEVKIDEFMSLDSVDKNVSDADLTSLIEADVVFDAPIKEGPYISFAFEFVGRLCNVKCLKLTTRVMEVPDSAFSALDGQFHNLRELELDADWRFISKFLENADNLEVLTICNVDKDLKYWMEPELVPTCLLSKLGTVRIDHFVCIKPEFDLVRYLLVNGKFLKTMEIHYPTSGIRSKKKDKALEKVSLFERASEECEVNFH